MYLTVLLGMSTFSVVLTSFILNIFHRTDSVGPKVTALTHMLQVVTCNNNPEHDEERKHDTTLEPTPRPDYDDLDDVEARYKPEKVVDEKTCEYCGRKSNASETTSLKGDGVMTWQEVAKTFDWFFYIVFSSIVVAVTVVYLVVMVYEGVYNMDKYNETGQLRPWYGRDHSSSIITT